MNCATASGTSFTAGAGPQPKRSSPASSLVIRVTSALRSALHQGQGVLQHYLAFRRGAQILVATVHQHTAELLLQPLNTAAERRLSDAHGVGRADKTAVFVEGDEVAQLAKIHMLLRHPKNSSKAFATKVDRGFKCKLLFRQRSM